MPATKVLAAVTNGADVKVVVQTQCNRVELVENAGGSTANLTFKGVAGAAPGFIEYPAGRPLTLERPVGYWQVGEILGVVRSAGANIDVSQLELP